MTRDHARILAQLAHDDRAMNPRALAVALAWDDADVARELEQLRRQGMVKTLRPLGMPGVTLYETTDRGRIEASGGAQLTITGAPARPPMPAQPALF